MVDNLDGGFIVLIDDRGLVLGLLEIVKDGAEVEDNFGDSGASYELCLGTGGGGDRLGLGAISNNASSKTACIASGRSALAEFIAVGCVDIGNELKDVSGSGKLGE